MALLVLGDFSPVRVGVRRVEFLGKPVAEFGVEKVLNLVSRFVEMIGRYVKVTGHVALPQTVGPDQLSGGMSTGLGEFESAG